MSSHFIHQIRVAVQQVQQLECRRVRLNLSSFVERKGVGAAAEDGGSIFLGQPQFFT